MNKFKFSATVLVLAGSAYSSLGFAEEAICKPVLDSMMKGMQVPSHRYRVKIDAGNHGAPADGEMINTGKDIYIKSAGKWILSPMSVKAMQDQMVENRKNSKVTCKFLRDETVDGVGASLFEVHEDNDGGLVTSKIWIAKASGLPVHTILDIDDIHSEQRIEYGAVSAPPVN